MNDQKLDVMGEEYLDLPEDHPDVRSRLTPQQHERRWYKNVYKGDDMPQLSVRAVLMGSCLGGFMALSNLYVGLKTGWGLGVAITACILSFAIHKTMMAAFPRWFSTEMSILENNCMQSTASSAGYSTGGTMVSAIAAYLIVTGHHMPWPTLAVWTFCLAALGVFMAVPMKRQMINVEKLKFPSGIAAAETLKSLHSKGAEADMKAKSLGVAAALGGIVAWLRDAGKPFAIPGMLNVPGTIGGLPLAKYTLSFEMSSILMAAGAIMGWKIAWSLLLGAFINYALLAPWMVRLGAIDGSHLGYRAIVQWSTWTGASMMVTSGLFMFALQWRTMLRAFSGLSTLFAGRAPSKTEDRLAAIEVPTSWFLGGTLLSGLGCIGVLYFAFDTRWWMGVIAVLMTFFLAIVACRVTGECDTTPIGAMGKITQLAFGFLAPANIATNLMTASVTAGAAAASADLLTDLKSGYLLGANPRKQFIAQFLGIFAGTLVVVPAFYLLVPNAAALGTDQWPAPSAQVWAAVAKLLSKGLHALHPTARLGLLCGGLLGLIIPLLEKAFPKQQKYIPSATGLGLSMVIPFFNSLSMFLGALIALILEKKKPLLAERYIITVSSGLIAGESLVGVAVALLSAFGLISPP
ncbi:MAG: OPT family oligopeptide transporter [Elusimicrobiota bacterium]